MTNKRDAAREAKPATIVGLPTKVSEVAKWLVAHPNVEPSVLASHPKQKASEMAAAVRALATIATPAALDVLASYRPPVGPAGAELNRQSGTFAKPVAKELIAAWRQFDRRRYAQRMFSGLRMLHLQQMGELVEDLAGIDAADGLCDLRVSLDPACDLSPLEHCLALSRLDLLVPNRRSKLAPIARIPALTHLQIGNGGALDQPAVDAIGDARKVELLYLSVGAGIDLGMLVKMRALKRLKLGGEGFGEKRRADAATVSVLRALLERGVDICLYAREEWTFECLKALDGMIVVGQSDSIALTGDASLVKALRSRLPSSFVLTHDASRAEALQHTLFADSSFLTMQ